MALLQFWRDNLKSSYEAFYEILDLHPFLDELVARKAITKTQSTHIQRKRSHKKQVNQLLDIIHGGADGALEMFVEVLKKTNIPLAVQITGVTERMKQANIDDLDKHRYKLTEKLNLDQLLDDLKMKQAITQQDKQLILDTVKHRQTAELLDILKTKPDPVYYMFIDSLQKTELNHQPKVYTLKVPTLVGHPAEPVLTLDVKQSNKELGKLHNMHPLVDGGVVVQISVDYNHEEVLLLDDKADEVRMLYEERTSNTITGFIQRHADLLVLYKDGTIRTINIQNGKEQKQYKVQAKYLYDGILVDEETLVLVDHYAGTVIHFSLADGHTNILVQGLSYPRSIDIIETKTEKIFIVCEWGKHNVHIYSESWEKVLTVGGRGVQDGKFRGSYCAIFLPDSNFLVADSGNSRVCEFNMNGGFIRNLKLGDINRPDKLRYHNKHLWLGEGIYPNYNVKKYQIYK